MLKKVNLTQLYHHRLIHAINDFTKEHLAKYDVDRNWGKLTEIISLQINNNVIYF